MDPSVAQWIAGLLSVGCVCVRVCMCVYVTVFVFVHVYVFVCLSVRLTDCLIRLFSSIYGENLCDRL